jgi:hypothetical protein
LTPFAQLSSGTSDVVSLLTLNKKKKETLAVINEVVPQILVFEKKVCPS